MHGTATAQMCTSVHLFFECLWQSLSARPDKRFRISFIHHCTIFGSKTWKCLGLWLLLIMGLNVTASINSKIPLPTPVQRNTWVWREQLTSLAMHFALATRYWLNGPGIESRWRRDFPHPSRPALGPTQPPLQWVPALSWGVKRPGRGADHPPLSSAEVKGRV